ncbi:class I SAM-dependent methyltransferase [Streptomyces sp. NPDC014622]|uniref:class I SAM-dependent methyltransferase n=1 Tax=Streptomyces sp. NPDC014622 TaxID=3364874 RepID=UPI0036FB80FA
MPDRALGFGATAESYERFRPGYPAEVFDMVMAYARPPVRTALETGAGTGKATRLFAQQGVAVIATDPDTATLAELRKHVPTDVRTARAAFEDLRPGEKYRLVHAGAALHWTKPDGRWSRMAALLEPGGVFASFGGPLQPADPAVEEAVRAMRAPSGSARLRIVFCWTGVLKRIGQGRSVAGWCFARWACHRLWSRSAELRVCPSGRWPRAGARWWREPPSRPVGGVPVSGAARCVRALFSAPDGCRGWVRRGTGAGGVRPVVVRVVPGRACNRGVLAGGWAERIVGPGGSGWAETLARTDPYRATDTPHRH